MIGAGRIIARRFAVVALVASFGVILPAAPADASYAQRQREILLEIAQKREAIRRAEAEERNLLALLAGSDAQKDVLNARLRALQGQLFEARDQLAVMEGRIDVLTASLSYKASALEATQAQLDDQLRVFNARVSQIYMNSPSAFGRGFAVASNFQDLLVVQQYEANAVRSDVTIVRAIEKTRRMLEAQRAEIQSQQQELLASRQTTIDAANRIAAIRDAQARARDAVQHEINVKAGLLGRVRTQKEAYERAIRELESESRSIEAFLRNRQHGQHVVRGIGGYLKWPLSGTITSPFGPRVHPIFHTRSFHTGIDIAASQGTPVSAARRGKVLDTGYRGGYGLVVIIDHGDSLATIYAHLSRVFVEPGAQVAGGQTIGAVGMTGWATGPHLHFEVRSAGTPTDPVGWL